MGRQLELLVSLLAACIGITHSQGRTSKLNHKFGEKTTDMNIYYFTKNYKIIFDLFIIIKSFIILSVYIK